MRDDWARSEICRADSRHVVFMQDFRAYQEGVPDLVTKLAGVLGIPVSAVKGRVRDGDVTYEALQKVVS